MTDSPDDTPRSRRGTEELTGTGSAATERATSDRAEDTTTENAAGATTVLLTCRGTWLVHQDGTGECTETGCTVPAEAHEFVGRCSAVLTSCGCATG